MQGGPGMGLPGHAVNSALWEPRAVILAARGSPKPLQDAPGKVAPITKV